MLDTEIIVAIIGASVTLTSPFLALFIKNYCEKKSDENNDVESNKSQKCCEIYKTELPFGGADITRCKSLKKSVCPNCGLTFCEHHLHVNNNILHFVGGHMCNGRRP